MTNLAILMIYGCCTSLLLLFGTKSRPLCKNYNFELLMHKYDRAYSSRNFRRKYMCVVMKCNTVLLGKTYKYYTKVNNMLLTLFEQDLPPPS